MKRAKREHDAATAASLAQLFSLGTFDRNQITREEIDRIRDMIDRLGGGVAAERVGVCETTVYRVAAGFGHRLLPATAAKVRKFLRGR